MRIPRLRGKQVAFNHWFDRAQVGADGNSVEQKMESVKAPHQVGPLGDQESQRCTGEISDMEHPCVADERGRAVGQVDQV